jgi:hypothetical protein
MAVGWSHPEDAVEVVVVDRQHDRNALLFKIKLDRLAVGIGMRNYVEDSLNALEVVEPLL